MSAAPPTRKFRKIRPRRFRTFLRQIIAEDLAHSQVGADASSPAFPPSPTVTCHIGHAKAICLNFGLAAENGGTCHLRFDDTNPVKEDVEYAEAIMETVRWLGFDWGRASLSRVGLFRSPLRIRAPSDQGGARLRRQLVTPEELRRLRGTLTEPGKRWSLPRPFGRAEPRPVPAPEGGRIPRRRARAAAQDRPDESRT